MRYRVAFAKRIQSTGTDSPMNPSAELDQNLSDGIVADKAFVEQLESEAQHSQEVLDEDDAFLGSAAPEVWEYEVVDARASEFEDAIENSDLVLEYDVVDTTPTSADDVMSGVLPESGVYPLDGGAEGATNGVPGRGRDELDVTTAGSGARAGDDGPAGMPTVDPSAGGLGSAASIHRAALDLPDQSDSGTIDDLNIVDENDSSLGLTNRGNKPAQDWAANTGPAHNPARGVESDHLSDDESTLAPESRKRPR